jgi:hypothetical protein
MKAVASGIFLVIAFLVLRYVAGAWFRQTITRVAKNDTSCLTMLGNTTRDEEQRTYIVGSIRNDCTRRYSQVTVNFKLERPRGPMENMTRAVAYAYIRDIKPGETREFKSAIPLSKDVVYQYDGINAY